MFNDNTIIHNNGLGNSSVLSNNSVEEYKMRKDIINKLEGIRSAFTKSHYECEDSWYSCPKSEIGCSNDSLGDECSCGSDSDNALLNTLIDDVINDINGLTIVLQPSEPSNTLPRQVFYKYNMTTGLTQHSKPYDSYRECLDACREDEVPRVMAIL